MFEGLETGGYAEFQDRVQGADKSTLHWIAAQLMNPTIDTPQGERMLQTMSKTNIFSGGQHSNCDGSYKIIQQNSGRWWYRTLFHQLKHEIIISCLISMKYLIVQQFFSTYQSITKNL